MGSSINEGTSNHHGHITMHRSGPGLHTGCSLGRLYPSEVCGTDAAKWATSNATLDLVDDIRRAGAKYLAGTGSLAAVDSLFAALTTSPSGSPWTNTAASWWSGLTTAQKSDQLVKFCSACVDVRHSS
jgi:hypothetical protein